MRLWGWVIGLGCVVGVGVGCVSAGEVGGEVEVEVEGRAVPIGDRYARARLILLDAINDDRALHGAPPVALDSLATVVAQGHARAMARDDYLSHYGTDGSAPYERFALAGGVGHVRENVFRWSRRPPDPRDDGRAWPQFDVREAEAWLMASPGHRATILDPSRTHVGIGIVEDRAGAVVYVVQEFLARHLRLEVPTLVWRSGRTTIRGRMIRPGTRPLLVYVSREPEVESWRGPPPGGGYVDGGEDGVLVPPWRIEWNRSDASFELVLDPAALGGPGRYYGIVYVASEEGVRRAMGVGRVGLEGGYPGAAFIFEVL